MPSAERAATGLGWASLGLGLPMLAPDAFARALGVDPTPATRRWTLAVAARELSAFAGLVGGLPPGRRAWQWSRVAGDLKDLTLLLKALRDGPADPGRTKAAIGGALAIGATDLVTAIALTRKPTQEDRRMQVKAQITTVRPREEVERAWATSEEIAALRELGEVRECFTEAPGDRGTEIHIVLDAKGGPVVGTVKKVLGTEPRQQAFDRLRRFKQVLETGEVARSDGSPVGHSAKTQPKQRPAQPVERTEEVRA